MDKQLVKQLQDVANRMHMVKYSIIREGQGVNLRGATLLEDSSIVRTDIRVTRGKAYVNCHVSKGSRARILFQETLTLTSASSLLRYGNKLYDYVEQAINIDKTKIRTFDRPPLVDVLSNLTIQVDYNVDYFEVVQNIITYQRSGIRYTVVYKGGMYQYHRGVSLRYATRDIHSPYVSTILEDKLYTGRGEWLAKLQTAIRGIIYRKPKRVR